jgi:hypothetical protein
VCVVFFLCFSDDGSNHGSFGVVPILASGCIMCVFGEVSRVLIFGAVLVVRQIAYRSVNCYKICSVLIVFDGPLG